jgi:hypothetical protein
MTKHSKLTLAAFALLLPALMPVTAKAQTAPNFARPPAPATPAPPQVVAFVGDWLTVGWSATFPANWTNYSINDNSIAQQVAAAIAQKPSIIHVMIGSAYIDDDAGWNIVTTVLEADLIGAITTAEGAGIPVVVGIEPSQFVGPQGLHQMAIEVYAIATKYGVPIINYNGAFNSANFATLLTPTTTNQYSGYAPTTAGYKVLSTMAQTAFTILNAQPRSVYLQDTEQPIPPIAQPTQYNVNTVQPGTTVDFYPVITYTNGATISYTNGVTAQAGFNTNFLTGTYGTWTSSNPAVGFVDQYGGFNAFNVGSTTVKFTLPNGVWNEWIMYVGAMQ